MRYFLAALLGALLGGCTADMDDRAFFNRGWVAPEKGAQERLDRF